MDALQRWFKRFSLKVERFLLKLTVFFLVLVVLVQLLMTNQSARSLLNRVEKMEGEPYRVMPE